MSEQQERVFSFLQQQEIEYSFYTHPEAPTIEIARQYWHNDGSKHCKNLFFRNHKGNRHYLVVFDSDQSLAIHDLEHRLHQGKLSFASEQRMERYLGLKPGSVSPFGLMGTIILCSAVLIPIGGFALGGIQDYSLMTFIRLHRRFKKNKRILTYRGTKWQKKK